MTPTNSLPPQPIVAKPLPKTAGHGKEQAQDAPAGEGAKGFASLFSQLMGDASTGGLPQGEGEAAGTDGEPLPGLPRSSSPAKGVRPEDVLPPELLLTLYPQMANPQRPTGGGNTEVAAETLLKAVVDAGELTAKLAPQPMPATNNTPASAAKTAPQSAASAAFAAALASADAVPVAQTAAPAPTVAPVQTAAALSPAVQQALAPAVMQQDAQGLQKTAAAAFRPADKPPVADTEKLRAAAETDAVSAIARKPEGDADTPPLPPEQVRDTRLAVTRQETVFAPVGQPPVSHQAAERIIAELKSTDQTAAPQAATPQRDATPAPVRMLHLQLQPADLGLLTVRLSLRESGLDIKLEAAEHRTARLLEGDREMLSDMLRTAGYVVDGLSVQFQSADKPAPAFQAFAGSGADNGPQSGAQSQAGGAQPDTQRGNQSGRGSDQGGALPANGEEGDPKNPARSADGNLYL